MSYNPRCSFSVLPIGSTFDWIDDSRPGENSFLLRCMKISPRRYEDTRGVIHRIGTIKATVYHVEAPTPDSDSQNLADESAAARRDREYAREQLMHSINKLRAAPEDLDQG